MTKTSKLVLTGLIVCVLVVVWQANRHEVASPRDMPSNATFLQSGFNVATSEPEGNWIACSLHSAEGLDWCRVTDPKGIVVYQGDFLPVSSTDPLPDGQLAVAPVNPKKIWVHGPVEDSPVPAIPLRNGGVLVPASDRYALLQRWKADPYEYDKIRDNSSE